jgi:hypothetical protein
MNARDVIAKWLIDGGFAPPHLAPSFADSLMAKMELSSESVRLELAALLNPWRPGPAPENDDLPADGVEITQDGKWWRYLLPPAPPSEDKP